MTQDELFQQLNALAMLADEQIGNTKCYVFGSATRDLGRAADVDLLVICKNHSDADQLRRIFGKVDFFKPIDLAVLTEQEEAEVRFVENQHCMRIFPPDD